MDNISNIFEHIPATPESNSTTAPFTWDNMERPTIWSFKFAAAYTVLHVVYDTLFLRRLLTPDKLKSLKWHERVYFGEKICSTLNGLLLGIAGHYLLLVHPTFKGEFGIFSYYPRILDYVLSSYVGYSFYVMGTMVLAGNEPVSMWMHHIVGLLGAYLMMIYRRAAYFPVCFLVTEVTVVPTNLVWYLRLLGVSSKSTLYQRSMAARNASFLLQRAVAAPLCIFYAYSQLPGNSSEKLSAFIEELKSIPWLVTTGTAINVGILGSLNLWWTLIALRNWLKKLRVKPKTQ